MDSDDELREAVEVFLSQRARLLRIAYRVTGGDAARAEDVVQEVWLRWQRTDRSTIGNPEAFLTTATTRVAINVVQAASRRHELPSETVPARPRTDEVMADPAEHVDRTAQIAAGLAALMARVTGAELAALVLRKAFDYPYAEIARLLRTSAVNARQLVRRAGVRLTGGPQPDAVAPEAHRLLVATFLAAARRGELAPLERLLVPQDRWTAQNGAVERSRSARGSRALSVHHLGPEP